MTSINASTMTSINKNKPSTQILIIHVRSNEERRIYVEGQVRPLGMPYTFINDGNKEDLTPEIIERYFIDNGREDTMYGALPHTSCAYKHILAMQYIISQDLEGALILEDDIRLKADFLSVFNQSMDELRKEHNGEACIVNYEESSLMLVPRSQRRKGKVLYKANRDRFAGCLYITRNAAERIMKYIMEHKSAYTSDILHYNLIKQGVITYYWSYPCIACQCSCDGSMPTMIQKPRPYKRLKWFYKKVYKHILYFFR